MHVFNPQHIGRAAPTFRWSPIVGCEDPATAIRRADAFAFAVSKEGVEDGTFWSSKASDYLRGYFHAAALAGYDMRTIAAWVSGSDPHVPERILNAAGAQQWALILAELRSEAQSRECGPTTRLRIFATLRAALNAAVRQRKITWNPCDGVELEQPDTAERQRWTPAEAAQFIDATAGHPMGLMFRVGVLRAARRAELCGFRWADTVLEKPYRDPETGEERLGALLGVERPMIQIGGKVRESKPKTKMGQRRVFLDHETAGLLREHRKAQLRLRLKAGEAWQDNDLVFCQGDGRPWNPDHVSEVFKKQAALADVPVICLHEGGRHTGNSLMQDAGVDQELRMREVGHADKSVNDRYTHPLEQAHLAAAEQTAALVRKARTAA